MEGYFVPQIPTSGARDVPMGAWGAVVPTPYFQICKKVGQKLARELATVLSVTIFLGTI